MCPGQKQKCTTVWVCTRACERTRTSPELYIYARADSGYVRLLPFYTPVERTSIREGRGRLRRKLREFSCPEVCFPDKKSPTNSLMNTKSRAECLFILHEKRVWRLLRGRSCFFSAYLKGYTLYVQYLSSSPNSNQPRLSSVTLSGHNLQSPGLSHTFMFPPLLK